MDNVLPVTGTIVLLPMYIAVIQIVLAYFTGLPPMAIHSQARNLPTVIVDLKLVLVYPKLSS